MATMKDFITTIYDRCAVRAVSFIETRMGRRIAISAATVFLAILPFWFVTGHSALQEELSNKAMAATDARMPVVENGGHLMDEMSPSDRARHARELRDLVGSEPDQILSLLGSDVMMAFSYPELRRVEGAVRVWQYRGKNCVLDVYLQDKSKTKATKDAASDDSAAVVHYEIRQRDKAVLRQRGEVAAETAAPNAASCVQAIIDASPARANAQTAMLAE